MIRLSVYVCSRDNSYNIIMLILLELVPFYLRFLLDVIGDFACTMPLLGFGALLSLMKASLSLKTLGSWISIYLEKVSAP
jgi:hypothetical protein